MKITKAKKLKTKVEASSLGFGKCFTDYMFVMRYENDAWQKGEILPYSPFTLDPSCAVFHYGQAIFEGLKAYRSKNGGIMLFRPRDNINRLNTSAERMCIPKLPSDEIYEGLIELLKLEKDWVPNGEGTSLYIRPTVIATEKSLSVHASREYIFFIILSPVGAYYTNGLEPVRLCTENEYIRAAVGGTGHHKFAGNYAASMLAGEKAAALGYDQVLWLDAAEKKYVEEVGSMNIFFMRNGEAVTPALLGSILPGITRDSVIKLLESSGVKVKEERISIADVIKGIENGAITEIFGTGTAAVISPVGTIAYMNKDYMVNEGKMGEISTLLYNKLTGIQNGSEADKFNWTIKL